MIINDNYLKKQLKHVYWLTGGPCSGKTTMSKQLVEKYGFKTLDVDFPQYRPYFDHHRYDPLKIPYAGMDWQWYFNRPLKDYVQWMLDTGTLALDFFITDLLKSDPNQKLVVDCGIEVEHILPFIGKNQIIACFTTDEEIANKYLHRDDHNMIWRCIDANLENKNEAIENVNQAMIGFSHAIKSSTDKHHINTIIRTPDLSIEAQLSMITSFFNLEKKQ